MRTLFNDKWEFALKPVGELPESSDFCAVDIPHDWLIFDAKNLYKSGDGWYRKRFFAENTAKKVFSLRFEGVYMDSEVFLNGEKIFEWKYGYTTFDVPLNGIHDGENEISVRVRYQSPNSRWYSGAGIFRNIWLRETGEDRIADDGTYIVSYIEGKTWRTEVDTEIICNTSGTLRLTLIDADGETVLVSKMPFPEGTKKVSQSFDIDSPELWSINSPYLYSILTELVINDEAVDSRFERIGYKFVRFDPNAGFFLNGKNIKLNGVCMHHDLGALGSAVNRAATRRQLISLKEMGVNSIRTSHNPPSVELMELCDELGILVDSEAFDMWELKKTDYDYSRFFKDWHEKDVRSWVRRDRNHACLLMWSIGNEIYDTHASPHGVEITNELSRCVHIDDYKNAHPITIGSNYMRWEGAQNCAKCIDVVGYNYTEDIYDEHHKNHPNWIIYGSETGSTVQSRGIYHFPASVFATTHDDLQCSSLMNCATGWSAPNVEYNICEDRKRRFSLGQYVWTGWDYIGEPTPYRTKNSYFGHVDTAGFPKDSYYAYKAEWNTEAEPFVHILPYWDFNEGQLIDVFIFSNCAKTELFVNGKSFGSFKHDHKNGEHLTGRWQVPYHRGEIKAVGYNEYGEKVCEEIKKSFKDPARIVLQPDRTSLFANGEDMIFVTVSTVDEDGNTVENARNRMNVEVSGAGRLVGLDNGDSSDYEQYKSSSRKLFSGKLLAMIASKAEAGDITVTVSSKGLEPKTLTLKALPARIAEGGSYSYEIAPQPLKDDVSIRKIELSVSSKTITPDSKEAFAKIKLFPENSTYDENDISFKAVTDSGVETNLLKIEKTDGGARLIPRGDGKFRLRAFCKNGGDAEEVISETELEITGFGPAEFDPYSETVLASLCSNSGELQSVMEGGVLTNQGTEVVFSNVNFGKTGSDEITIGIYTYNEQKIPVILSADGKVVDTLMFQAKNEWNTYKFNTFKLPQKLSGVKEISFKFGESLRFKGFMFSSPKRIGEKILALDNTAVYGDSFEVGKDILEKIGNNVSIEFGCIDLKDGASAVEITGRTRNKKDTLHIRFEGEEAQIIEFENSPELITRRFEINKISGQKNLRLVFLPGCDFDLESLRFI